MSRMFQITRVVLMVRECVIGECFRVIGCATRISINQHIFSRLPKCFKCFRVLFRVLLMVRENDRVNIPSDPSDPGVSGE